MIKALQTLLEKIRREVRIVLFAALVACAVGGCATTTGTGGIAGVTAGMTKEQAARFVRKQSEHNPWIQSLLGMAYCADSLSKATNTPKASFRSFISLRNRLEVSPDASLGCEEGEKWLRRAAAQEIAIAQVMLGIMYLKGMGVSRDNAEGVKLIRRAAEQEVSFAQALLGAMYLDGVGVLRNNAEAVKWLRRAAEQGDPHAQTALGNIYAEGIGIPQDNAEAAKWKRRAAEQGGESSQSDMLAEMSKWHHRAAEQGKPYAQVMLGLMYHTGSLVPQSYREAYIWYSLATANGDDDAAELRNKSAKHLSSADLSSAQTESVRRHAEIQSGKGN